MRLKILNMKNKNNKVFIIAEAGVNHNGSLLVAKKLIKVASKIGADAIKFQTFITEEEITKKAPLAKYQKSDSKYSNQFDLVKKLEGGRGWCVLHQHRETRLIENILTKLKNNRTWLFDPPSDRNIIDKRVLANQAYHLSEHIPPIVQQEELLEVFLRLFQGTDYGVSHFCCQGRGIMYGKIIKKD